jgi:hypothetical protein
VRGSPSLGEGGVAVRVESPEEQERDQVGEVREAAGAPRSAHPQGSSTPSELGLQGSKGMRQGGAETLVSEEPYECIAHVRVGRGGPVG